MKIIALMPVKNEGWILKTTIPQLKKFADEILCLDAGSTDDTLAYLKSAETSGGARVSVRRQTEQKTNFSSWSRELLEWGRERGGTHFIWLDADEAFTTNFLPSFRDRLGQMKPGEKYALQWLCLWKSPHVYRDDDSIWSNLYKDFIICDDGKISFELKGLQRRNVLLHQARTPGPNANPDGSSTWTRIPSDEGAVLHFQFVPFKRFQVKQAFQRCRERAMDISSPRRINSRYSTTLDDPGARTKTIPPGWLAGIGGLDMIASTDEGWFVDAILAFFREKGILYFEPLQIWHVPKLREIFVKEIGREPKSKTYPAFLVHGKKILDKIKKRM